LADGAMEDGLEVGTFEGVLVGKGVGDAASAVLRAAINTSMNRYKKLSMFK